MKPSNLIVDGAEAAYAPTVSIDLDSFDLEEVQGLGGLPVASVDVYRGGKRVTFHLSLMKSCSKREPTMVLTAVNRRNDVTRSIQAKPWCNDSEEVGK